MRADDTTNRRSGTACAAEIVTSTSRGRCDCSKATANTWWTRWRRSRRPASRRWKRSSTSMRRIAFATPWSGSPRAWSSIGRARARICRSSRSPKPTTASRSRRGRRGSSWPADSTSRLSCRPRAWPWEAKAEVITALPARRFLPARRRSSWKLRTGWSGNNWDEANHVSPIRTERLATPVGPDPFTLPCASGTERSPARRIPSTDIREDVVVVPRDLLSRRFVHIDEGELGPRRMLPDLVPFTEKHEFEIPVILRPIHFGEDVWAVERVARETELLFEDPLRGRLW